MIFVIGPPTATGKKNGTSTGACPNAGPAHSDITDAQIAPSNRFRTFIVPPFDFGVFMQQTLHQARVRRSTHATLPHRNSVARSRASGSMSHRHDAVRRS